jgi:hypothetical protein
MPLNNTTITLSANGGEYKELGSGSTRASFPGDSALYQHQITLQSGTGAAKAQKVGLASFSLTGGASVTFDLTAFPGPFGNVNFTSVKDFIGDLGTSADVFEVGDDGTVANPWTAPFSGTGPRIRLMSGACIRLSSPNVGFAVDATHKTLMVKNTGSSTNAASGNVLLIGEGS